MAHLGFENPWDFPDVVWCNGRFDTINNIYSLGKAQKSGGKRKAAHDTK